MDSRILQSPGHTIKKMFYYGAGRVTAALIK